MGRCLNCGAETIFPPMCDACMSAPHRDGCRCQECFDRLRKELAAEREAVRVLGEYADAWPQGNYDYTAQAQRACENNPIASAAITDAAKAMEG